MPLQNNIVILGNGRIARAIFHFFRGTAPVYMADLLASDNLSRIKNAGLLIGALSGDAGETCLKLALKYQKNLIDISDVDPPFYLKNKKNIARLRITVVPGCGFSPGLVNLIAGHELSKDGIKSVELKAGSISAKKFFFPFLWCLDDLLLEHRIKSLQLIEGRIRKFRPFAGYKRERYFNIGCESYYCPSGFENMLGNSGTKNFISRVIRPAGFAAFFKFLENQGFLNKANIETTKKALLANKEDNITLSEIIICDKQNNRAAWILKSFSKRRERLNSMQKITAVCGYAVGKLMLGGALDSRGLMFMDELGRDRDIFEYILKQVKAKGIIAGRK